MAFGEFAVTDKKTHKSKLLGSFDPEEMESRSAAEILTWAIKNYHPRLVLSASFGAPEGMALLDMMHRIEPTSRIRFSSQPVANAISPLVRSRSAVDTTTWSRH